LSPRSDTDYGSTDENDVVYDRFGNTGYCPRFPSIDPSNSTSLSALSVGTLSDGPDAYQYPVKVLDREIPLFRHFVDNLSQWLDLFDPSKQFASTVPQLALNNEGLMKAMLAASSRHLAIKASMEGRPKDTTDSIGYYAQALRFLQMGMKYQSYTRSSELLATVLIIALFEMLDGSPLGWERHLKGIFWIQRSQDSNGECGGLKQAIWWNWLNQDIWSAMRERRRVFSFYKPVRPYEDMEPYEIARRSTYLLAQAVNFSSKEEVRQWEYDTMQGQERAACLLRMLDEWRAALTVEFRPLPFAHEGEGAFAPIWISPPAFGTLSAPQSMVSADTCRGCTAAV